MKTFALPGNGFPILMGIMEFLWLYPWLLWISEWQSEDWERTPIRMAGALFLVVSAAMVSQFVLSKPLAIRVARVAGLGLSLVLLALVIRLELPGGYALWDLGWFGYALGQQRSMLIGGLIFGCFLIWRGFSAGREGGDFDTIYQRFVFGLVAFVVLFLTQGLKSGTEGVGDGLASSGMYAAGFFLVGLLGLALANQLPLWRQMTRYGEGAALYQRQWAVMLGGVVLGIVLVSLAIASIMSLDLLGLMGEWLGTAGGWMLTAFWYTVALPLAYVFVAMLYALRYLLSFISIGDAPDSFPSPSTDNPLEGTQEDPGPSPVPDGVILALKWGLIVLAVVGVVLILARVLFRYRRSEAEDEVDEVSESLWSWEAFSADIIELLSRLLRRFKRRVPVATSATSAPIPAASVPEHEGTLTVREIYSGLLWEAGQRNVGRRRQETPFEYQNRLRSRIDPELEELEPITQAFVEERYGRASIGGERLINLNQLWRKLRAYFRGEEARPPTPEG